MKKIVYISALILGLTGCHNSNPSGISKTYEYNLKRKCPNTLVMKVGETLVLRIPDNPSTGYQWQTVQPVKLFHTEETYKTGESDQKAVGVEGERTYRFKALKPGYEIIDLVYVRPWNNFGQADRQWQCHVRIS